MSTDSRPSNEPGRFHHAPSPRPPDHPTTAERPAERPAEKLTEDVRDWRGEGVTVDRQGRYVRNVALAGPHSSNGYRYSERALRDAVPLYAGKPVFLDHPQSVGRPYDRSTRDLVGSVARPRYEGGRVRGDIRVIDTEAGRTFLALAESDAAAVGMSHVVLAERSPDGRTVERLRQVVSVDAVAFPASTKSLRESHADPPTNANPADADLADADLADADLADADLADADPADVDLAALTAEREQLRSEVAELRRERDRLTGQLDERRTTLNAVPAPRPLSVPREPSPPDGITDERFVAAVRRR